MSDRPTELDLALDAIDEAFSESVKGMSRSLQSYAAGEGPGPRTADQARTMARGIFAEARRQRDAAISLVREAIPN